MPPSHRIADRSHCLAAVNNSNVNESKSLQRLSTEMMGRRRMNVPRRDSRVPRGNWFNDQSLYINAEASTESLERDEVGHRDW
jgi:hypothetical protein